MELTYSAVMIYDFSQMFDFDSILNKKLRFRFDCSSCIARVLMSRESFSLAIAYLVSLLVYCAECYMPTASTNLLKNSNNENCKVI